MALSDADLACHETPWQFHEGYGKVRLYSRLSDGSLHEEGFLNDAAGYPIDIGDCSTPVLFDYNGDGLTDLLLGTYGPNDYSGAMWPYWRVYLNSGSATQYRFDTFSLLSDAAGLPIASGSIRFADFDHDGRQDLLVQSKEIPIGWYRNVGDEMTPVFETVETLDLADPLLKIMPPRNFGIEDLDGDGFLDIAYTRGAELMFAKGLPFVTATQTSAGLSVGRENLHANNGRLYWKASTATATATRIELIGLDGRVQSVLNDKSTAAGLHSAAVPATLAKGFYIARMTVGPIIQSAPLIIR